MAEVIQLGDGWTKDKDGVVRDPDGYVWYGYTNQSQEVVTKAEDNPIIHDEGSGSQKILKIYQCKNVMGLHLPMEEVYRNMEPTIKSDLVKQGLTMDENYAPRIQQVKDITVIVLVCDPSKVRANIYDGVKEGQGGVNYVGGRATVFHKTDNINTLLAQKKNG